MKIAYLAPEVPALSATFVYNEILQLEELDTEVIPFSVHKPFSEVSNPALDKVKEKVIHIYEYSKSAVILCHLLLLIQHPIRYLGAFKLLLADMLKLGLFSRRAMGLAFRYFYAGKVAKDLMQHQCQHIHVHFAHVPTDIAMYAASFSDISFSVTAHANDLFERGWLLKEKVERAAFFATISEFNQRFLSTLGIKSDKVRIVRCGVDAEQFSQRNNFVRNQPLKLGVIGRLVEKKGIDTLVQAIKVLHYQGEKAELLIAGSGPLKDELARLVFQTGLTSNEVKFLGAIPHTQVAEFIESLDAFVLPCKQDKNGDMDGIPVVLMEAMLSGVPVISTKISGIPELVIDKETGLLVEPNNEHALAAAILTLSNDDILRENMMKHAVTKVQSEFSLQGNTKKLYALFRESVANKNGNTHRV